MLHDRRELLEERFRTLLLKWLASLPADGWEGTSHDLGNALYAFGERQQLSAYVPLCPVGKVASLLGVLTDNDFTLTHHRTKHARTVRFTRSARGT